MASEETDRLGLPYLMPAQAQKHVTVNEALRKLDALVQPRVLSRTVSAEPASPVAGDAYVLPAGASGAAWDGFAENDLVVFQDGAWEAFGPKSGWQVFDAGEGESLIFDGTAWRNVSELIGELHDLARLGIGTGADAANPFSAKLNAALWTALETANGGSGDLRYTLNKEAAGNVLSLLFQSGWSGRAEIGLVANDDLSLKVSDDGSTWVEAVRVNRETGALDLAAGPAIGGVPTASMLFTPGGDGVISFWRLDRSHGPLPRTAIIDSVAGDVITMTAGDADLFYDGTRMSGVSRIRIWNTSKSPDESAWIAGVPDWATTRTQLQVSDAAHVAGWQAGETIQVGEIVSGGYAVAVDIAPMLQNIFGQTFRQSGIVAKTVLTAATAGDTLQLSPSGAPGTFVATAQTQVAGQAAGAGVTVIPCTELSPISNSNLFFVREVIATTATLEILSSIAVYR